MADGELIALLREIRDGQRLALERQSESLALQARSAAMMKAARAAMAIILPVAFALVIYLSWLIFR